MKFLARKTLLTLLLLILAVGAASAGTIKIDKNHSTVGFSVPILDGMSEVTGKFTDFDITLTLDEKDLTHSSVKATIQAKSVSTGIEARDNHLRTADFFDVEKNPTITFQSKNVALKGDHFLVTGDLTLHGVTKEVVLDVVKTGEAKNANDTVQYGFKAVLRLDRTDYGMKWKHSAIANFVSDKIDVDLHILGRTLTPAEVAKQAEAAKQP